MTTETHIAFLRAVNVGGRKVPMARLREVLTALGLESVRTYIASGNVFFTGTRADRADRAGLVGRIEDALARAFGFEIPTSLRTVPELEAELSASPFVSAQPAENERFSMVFASGPMPAAAFPLQSAKGDWEVLGASGATAFAVWRRLGDRPPGNPIPAIEKAFGVRATGRFFHTTEKILAEARKA